MVIKYAFNIFRSLEEPEMRMQSRKLRFKNVGYLGLFTMWYAGVILYLMYRMKSNDLEELEQEALDNIKYTKNNNLNRK